MSINPQTETNIFWLVFDLKVYFVFKAVRSLIKSFTFSASPLFNSACRLASLAFSASSKAFWVAKFSASSLAALSRSILSSASCFAFYILKTLSLSFSASASLASLSASNLLRSLRSASAFFSLASLSAFNFAFSASIILRSSASFFSFAILSASAFFSASI